MLDKYGVELIGAKIDSIKKAEDRLLFKDAMKKIGLELPQSQLVNSIDKGLEFAARIGYPVILRPSFTMGGAGGGIAYNREEPKRFWSAASTFRRCMKSWSKKASSAGRNSSSK